MSYYHHAALRTRFRRIGRTWYCQLEPDYCFTTDGHTESRFADSLLAGIKRLDRHPAVLGWTRMWANYLTRPLDLFSPGRPVVFGALETVTVGRGIDDRWWGPAPADPAAEEDHELSRAESALATAELAAADIDTDDLAALLTGTSAESEPAASPQSRSGGARAAPAAGRTAAAMHAEVLDEPELEFGGGNRHIDPAVRDRQLRPSRSGCCGGAARHPGRADRPG